MKFKLMDDRGKDQIHEGVMPRLKAPKSVSWGSRVFVLNVKASGDDAAVYQEIDSFRIGR